MTPKYEMGMVCYIANTKRIDKTHDCPDCLGEKAWQMKTPAGSEFTVPCQRCSPGYISSQDLPPLKYHETVADVQEAKIVGIEIGPKIEYKIRSSTMGDNSYCTVEEPNMLLMRDQAEQTAEAKAREYNAEQAATPERFVKDHLSTLQWREARFDMFKNGLYQAWQSYATLRENVQQLLVDGGRPSSTEEMMKALEDYLSQDERYEFYHKPASITLLLRAVAKAVAENNHSGGVDLEIIDEIGEFWGKLPEFAKRAYLMENPGPDVDAIPFEVQ